jgi:hypothetical protein
MAIDFHTPSRYGCHECREDSELVMSNRATPEVRALYDDHIRTCRHCRRTHRVLYALYEGPVVPAAPMGVREEKEFYAALRRMKTERPEPWYHKLTIRAGIGVLATSAAALTLALFDVTPSALGLGEADGEGETGGIAALDELGTDGGVAQGSAAEPSSIRHHAQAYGRVVGGSGAVRPDGGDSTTSNTFPVGTHFEVGHSEALQVGLLGKIIANFTPDTEVTWVTGSPSLVELQLDEGMVAIRYDRDETDPILQVRTPTAVVRVVGTVFTVQVDETHEGESTTVVSVLRGEVEVINPKTNRTVAEVPSGNRYDVRQGGYDNVGRLEVQSALPISEEKSAARIPAGWYVPGVPSDPALRTLAQVPERLGDSTVTVIKGPIRVTGTTGAEETVSLQPVDPLRGRPKARKVENEGDDLIQDLMADAAATRRKELRRALEQCRDYYTSHDTRYLAGPCFGKFLEKYDDHPLAAEAYLLRGMLRHDYALDYRAAERDIKTYLGRAPNGRAAEKARYRLWLAATDDGRISEALARGRAYLDRYPNGAFVGKILQRFPELKHEL